MPESLTSQPADPRDVESIDAIIAAAYDVISGPAEQKRDFRFVKASLQNWFRSSDVTFDV